MVADSEWCVDPLLYPVVIREGVRCFALLWFALHGHRLPLVKWHAFVLSFRQETRISIRPCPTTRLQGRQRRLVLLPPRPTNMIITMLTFATLRQSRES